jgi:hypothetical protein
MLQWDINGMYLLIFSVIKGISIPLTSSIILPSFKIKKIINNTNENKNLGLDPTSKFKKLPNFSKLRRPLSLTIDFSKVRNLILLSKLSIVNPKFLYVGYIDSQGPVQSGCTLITNSYLLSSL